MSESAAYRVPASRHRVERTIDRSRFLCTVDRAADPEEAQRFIKAMNAELDDATHNCWAYIAGPPGSTSRIGLSDAGEPHGTAGRPMLTVLLHSNVGEIVAVVTRYYGGVKLGTGGLVKAYSGLVQLALESLPTIERVDFEEIAVTVGYASIAAMQTLFAVHGVDIDTQEFAADVRFRLRVPKPSLAAFTDAVRDVTRGSARFD